MAGQKDGIIQAILHRRVLRRWLRAAESAATTDLETLRQMRGRARQLRRAVDRVLHVAEGRLALPLIGANTVPWPLHADWAWRPQIWGGPIFPPGRAAAPNGTRFGDEATLYHDCAHSELTVRQIRNDREADLAPFGLRMDVFRFDGSFLSLVIELPEAAVSGLKLRHLIRMETIVELEKPLEIFARLNVRHGPNVEQLVRELPLHEEERMVEFDLAYTAMNEKRIERAWVDLIFEGPQMNQIVLRDLTFSRRPRSEM